MSTRVGCAQRFWLRFARLPCDGWARIAWATLTYASSAGAPVVLKSATPNARARACVYVCMCARGRDYAFWGWLLSGSLAGLISTSACPDPAVSCGAGSSCAPVSAAF